MPSVPRYNQPQVQQAGLPGARVNVEASEEAFGGGQSAARLTQATMGALDSVNKLVQEEKQKADETRVKASLADLIRKKQHRTFDPKEGALARKGESAFGIVDEYGQAFDKDIEELEKGLANDSQRGMFRQMATQQKLDFMGDLERHTLSEQTKYDEEVHQNLMAAARDEAVLNFQDPSKVAVNIERQRQLMIDRGTKQGKSTEVIQQEIAEATAQTHSGVVDRILSAGDDRKAKEYFEANKASFGKYATHVEKALEAGTIRGESQRQSDSILAKSQDMGSALSEARKIQDPKIRDAAVDRVKDYFSMQKIAENQRMEKAHQQAGNIIDKTGDVDKIPPQLWAQFSVSEKASLKSYAKHKREGTEPQTQWEQYYDLKTLASSPSTRDQFMQSNLMQYRASMADSEFKELVSLQTSLREKDGKADKELDGFRSDSQIVNDTLAKAGIDPTPKPGSKDAERVAKIRALIDQQQRSWQRDNGKKAPNDVMQGIVDNLLVKGVTEKGFLFDTKKATYELNPGESFDVSPKDIPRAERAKIEEALRRRKLPVSDESVKQLYLRKLNTMAQNGN